MGSFRAIFVAVVSAGCSTSAVELPRATMLPVVASASPVPAPAPALPAAVPAEPAPAPPAPPPAKPSWTAPSEAQRLSRPERQWQWIMQAGDDDCRQRLAQTQARFRALKDRAEPNRYGCGIPRGVALMRGPTGVKYKPAVRVDCSFALRLGEIESVLHAEAKQRFGAELVSIGTLGSYACREVVGRLRGLSGGISEHSFGNALDVTHFDLSDGQRISVLRHYPRERAPATREQGHFLRQSVARVWDETGMRALGPDFDRKHRDHLHFDAGSRWWRWK